MPESLQLSISNGVGLLSLNRPERRNAISEAMFEQLRKSVLALDQDSAVRVIVLRSAVPTIFCAGADIETLADPQPAKLQHQFELLVACVDAFRTTAKPVVTVIQGDCLGAGCSLAAASDVVIAGTSARFALPEVFLGMAPVLAMAALAPVVSMRNLIYWSTTGRYVPAHEARDAGLVTLVVPDAELETRTTGLTDDLSRHSGAALDSVKRAGELLGKYSVNVDSQALMKAMLATATHPEARKAIAHFLERKRRT